MFYFHLVVVISPKVVAHSHTLFPFSFWYNYVNFHCSITIIKFQNILSWDYDLSHSCKYQPHLPRTPTTNTTPIRTILFGSLSWTQKFRGEGKFLDFPKLSYVLITPDFFTKRAAACWGCGSNSCTSPPDLPPWPQAGHVLKAETLLGMCRAHEECSSGHN